MKIYTRTGDDGTTSLAGGRRVKKQHARIEAYGTVDELIAWIGMLRSDRENESRREILLYIQSQLMSSAAALAHESQNTASNRIEPDTGTVEMLEKEIDRMEALIPPLNSFILPGGTTAVSHCHVARVVCRRAERAVLKLGETEYTPESVRKLLNRLSDYLFVLGRLVSYESGNEEIKWIV